MKCTQPDLEETSQAHQQTRISEAGRPPQPMPISHPIPSGDEIDPLSSAEDDRISVSPNDADDEEVQDEDYYLSQAKQLLHQRHIQETTPRDSFDNEAQRKNSEWPAEDLQTRLLSPSSRARAPGFPPLPPRWSQSTPSHEQRQFDGGHSSGEMDIGGLPQHYSVHEADLRSNRQASRLTPRHDHQRQYPADQLMSGNEDAAESLPCAPPMRQFESQPIQHVEHIQHVEQGIPDEPRRNRVHGGILDEQARMRSQARETDMELSDMEPLTPYEFQSAARPDSSPIHQLHAPMNTQNNSFQTISSFLASRVAVVAGRRRRRTAHNSQVEPVEREPRRAFEISDDERARISPRL